MHLRITGRRGLSDVFKGSREEGGPERKSRGTRLGTHLLLLAALALGLDKRRIGLHVVVVLSVVHRNLILAVVLAIVARVAIVLDGSRGRLGRRPERA